MKPQKALTYNDVVILPHYSEVLSRKDVSLTTTFCGIKLDIPIISANMDTITETSMASAIRKAGGIGALHRFMTIDKNVEMYKHSPSETFVSIGLGDKELERADALYTAGARNFIIDVAHGASQGTVNQYNKIREKYKDLQVVVGNFATAASLTAFLAKCQIAPNAIKVGIGGSPVCTTTSVTGVGLPTLQSVLECMQCNIPIIADGGHATSGDIAKALAAGASAVMLGSMLAGTDETAGNAQFDEAVNRYVKDYRGSASEPSYVAQGKIQTYIAPEGIYTKVVAKGPVDNVVKDIAGGLRSMLSYLGVSSLDKLKGNAQLVLV